MNRRTIMSRPDKFLTNRQRQQLTIIKIAFGIVLFIALALILTSCLPTPPIYDELYNQPYNQPYYENSPGCVFLDADNNMRVRRCVDMDFEVICYISYQSSIDCMPLSDTAYGQE